MQQGAVIALVQLTSFGTDNPHYPTSTSVKVPEDKIRYQGCLFEGKRSIFLQKINLG